MTNNTNNLNNNYHNSSSNSHDHNRGGQGRDGQRLKMCVVPWYVIFFLSLFYCANYHYYQLHVHENHNGWLPPTPHSHDNDDRQPSMPCSNCIDMNKEQRSGWGTGYERGKKERQTWKAAQETLTMTLLGCRCMFFFSFFLFFFCCANKFLLLAHVANNDEQPLYMSIPNNNTQEHKKAQMTA